MLPINPTRTNEHRTDHTLTFAHGTAEIVATGRRFVRIRCPHCNYEHAHSKASAGSREVLAPCSTPYRPRSYAIPKN